MLENDRTRLLGTILLLAGSSIGAGMLALPIATGLAGFVPATVVFIVCWAFMTTTALLLLEVNVWLGTEVSIVSMAGRTLGRIGQAAAWILFCYLFYLLLVAYAAGSGTLVANFVEDYSGTRPPEWIGAVGCTLLFGLLVYWGTTVVDYVNRLFMVGLVVTYLLLIGLGLPEVRMELLSYMDWGVAWFGPPVVVIAFGLHNMIPTVTRYLNGNMRQLRFAIVMGTTIPLVIYLVWEWVILGIVPINDLQITIDRGDLATHALRLVVGRSWVGLVAEYFSFFAIVTSFLAQALSLLDFLADGFHTSAKRLVRAGLVLLAVVPPLIASLYNPHIFVSALKMAGAYGAVILFGLMPSLMVWRMRYFERVVSPRGIGGGRPLLVILILFSLFVMIVQFTHQLGLI